MNETLEAMVRALFTSWFVDFEPVRAKMAGRDTGLQTPIDDLFPIASLGSEIARYRKDGATERFADISLLNPESWSSKSPSLRDQLLPRIFARKSLRIT